MCQFSGRFRMRLAGNKSRFGGQTLLSLIRSADLFARLIAQGLSERIANSASFRVRKYGDALRYGP
jgi:hypothetical protein